MANFPRACRTAIFLFAAGFVSFASPLHAQTETFGANLGTLSYSTTSERKACINQNNQEQDWTITYFRGFSYTSPQNVNQSIAGSTWYYTVGYPGGGQCPADGTNGGDVNYNGGTYTIQATPGAYGSLSATISTSGYVDPKYTIVGVTYAPPGPSSYVDYTNSTLVNNTSTLSSSFTSASSFGVSTTMSTGIFGFAGGTKTASASADFSQGRNTSTTVSVSKTTSKSFKTPGPTNCPYSGIDHDYDIVQLWVNPLHMFTITADTAGNYWISWNGYGFSTLDQSAIDSFGLNVAYLNGLASMPDWASEKLKRPWAASPAEGWGSQPGPGLTSSDLTTLLDADPYGSCTWKSPIGSSDCPSPDPSRYTSISSAVDYEQLLNPPTQTLSYSNTSSLGQSIKVNSSQAFGVEATYSSKVSIFGTGIKYTVSTGHTEKWTNEWDHKVSSSTTSTAALSITGPPCNFVGGACDPVYPPANAYDDIGECSATTLPRAYGQAWQFDVYQDSVYGTFLFVPVAY